MTDRRFGSWRARLPVVAVVIACVAGVVAAVTGAANPVSAVRFLLSGHWVYNAALGAVFHVDGSAGQVDARAAVPGDAGDQVFQGDTSGYVVGDSRITEFGKSSLTVEGSSAPPSRAEPVGVETAGGPYLVYREDGKVVRLGHPHLVLSLGGSVGTPVATRDGTLWLPRTSAGLLCRLPANAKQVSCPVLLPKGHAGALAVVHDRPVFVDTTKDTLQAVEQDGLGEARDLGVDAADDARLASTDVAGRVAILDGGRMHLVDARGEAEPVTVDLGDGEFTAPVSTGAVVAVVNLTTHTLLTFDGKGKQKQSTVLPPGDGDPRLSTGEDDRIYVDDPAGEHVVVVDKDGGLTDVPIEAGDGGDPAVPPGGQDPDAPAGEPHQERPQGPPPEREKQPTILDSPEPENPKPPVVPPSPPGAPAGVSATAGDATATVSWGPATDNRSAITGYRITWAGGETTAGPAVRTATIPGLVNGTTYVFTVAAVNGVGTGPGVAANPVTPTAPVRPASAPTNLSADYVAGTRSADLTWAPPADLGGGTLTHYLVGMTGRPEVAVTATSYRFTGIAVTGTVTYTVKAVTTDATGRELVGAAGTHTATIDPGTVTISEGNVSEDPRCEGNPACHWVHISLRGLEPNTDYDLFPHSSDPDVFTGIEGSVRTDANGDADIDQFPYFGVGDTIYVIAESDDTGQSVRSNDIVWQ